jgi:hypothetical protein
VVAAPNRIELSNAAIVLFGSAVPLRCLPRYDLRSLVRLAVVLICGPMLDQAGERQLGRVARATLIVTPLGRSTAAAAREAAFCPAATV